MKRISDLCYEETRGVLHVFLKNVIRDVTEHVKRNMGVVYGLKRQGRALYRFGGQRICFASDSFWSGDLCLAAVPVVFMFRLTPGFHDG